MERGQVEQGEGRGLTTRKQACNRGGEVRSVAVPLSHWSARPFLLLYIKEARIWTRTRWFFETLVYHLLGLLDL